jgi:DNA invertase Pin-like site-specific DNA recombinase
VPGIVDLSELASTADPVGRIVLESMQELLLKLALQMARDDYERRRERQLQGIQAAKRAGRYKGSKPDLKMHERIIELRKAGHGIVRTADLAGCSVSQVKLVWSAHRSKTSRYSEDV